MSFRDMLARKRADERIHRRAKQSLLRQGNRDPEDVMEAQLNRYGNQAYHIGERVYNTTQKRKAEGKQIFVSTTKHMIGATYREIFGTKKKGKQTKRR